MPIAPNSAPPALRYSAPALDKGLDILELLANCTEGVTQIQIAQAMDRSVNEIFRMLDCLERRGYIRRLKPEDTYQLSPRLFELAHRHPPTHQLLDVALPVMRALASDIKQSCHLATRYNQMMLVVAMEESPDPVGVSVRVGSRFPLELTSSGRVLLAHQPDDVIRRAVGISKSACDKLASRLTLIRRRGYEMGASGQVKGITDLSSPILDHLATARAALTVPYLARRAGRDNRRTAIDKLVEAAARITRSMGGSAL